MASRRANKSLQSSSAVASCIRCVRSSTLDVADAAGASAPGDAAQPDQTDEFAQGLRKVREAGTVGPRWRSGLLERLVVHALDRPEEVLGELALSRRQVRRPLDVPLEKVLLGGDGIAHGEREDRLGEPFVQELGAAVVKEVVRIHPVNLGN